MLVITRKQDESIALGSDIVIRIIKLGKNSVRIGIEAPRSVSVCRGELALTESDFRVREFEIPTSELSEDFSLESMIVLN